MTRRGRGASGPCTLSFIVASFVMTTFVALLRLSEFDETTFALPDLRGRAAVGDGMLPGGDNYVLGQQFGQDSVVLTSANLPAHSHTFVIPEPGRALLLGFALCAGLMQRRRIS